MNVSQQEKAMIMDDPTTGGRDDGLGDAMTTHGAETEDQMTRGTAERGTTRALENSSSGPGSIGRLAGGLTERQPR